MNVWKLPIAVALAVALLVTAGSRAAGPAAASPPARAAQPSGDSVPAPGTPCDLVARRSVEPRVVEEGGTLEVTVDYAYRCSHENRRINFFLVVEATEALRGSDAHRDLLNNLKQAMTVFVNRVDYRNGSTGGLTLYAEDYSNRVTLRGGDEGRTALLGAIRRISVEPIGNSAGAPAAIRDTTERLPTGEREEVTNVLIVVDAGAPVTTRPLIDYETACGSAKQAGVVLAVIGLENAGSRGLGCASPGWGRRSQKPDGSDLEEIFVGLADALISGKKPDLEGYNEWFSQGFDYEARSAWPSEPEKLLRRQYVWSFERPPLVGSRSLRYRVRAEKGLGNRIAPLSLEATAELLFTDGSRALVAADNPEICVHERGEAGYCAGHGQPDPSPEPTEPTALPPTATVPPPTAEPSSLPPTAEPTLPPPSATPRPPKPLAPTIYLPLALGGLALEALPAPVTGLDPTATALPSATAEPAPTDPPTAEPEPTEPPTAEPTASPRPTETPLPEPSPTAAPELACQELLTNGDFESGARDWTLTVTTQRQQASRSIQHRSKVPIAPHGGDYLAWLGGLDSTRFELSSAALGRMRGEDVVSATLRYHVALIADGTRAGRPGDVLSWQLGEGRAGRVAEAEIADGDLREQRRWHAVSADVTEILQAGRARSLDLVLSTDDSRTSWFYLDDLSLTACHAAP